jgi:hypothetical protein
MKRLLLLAAVPVVALSVTVPKALWVNGKKSPKPPIEQGGEVYVPVSSLTAAGAEVVVGADRVSVQFLPVKAQSEQEYVEAIVGEWVGNGTWRFRVSNVGKIENPFGTGGGGFALDFEVRNAGPAMAQIAYGGVLSITLLDTTDVRMGATSDSFKSYYADLQPGGAAKDRLLFGVDAPGGAVVKEAAKLIIQFDKPAKSVRINLRPE